MNKKLAIGLSIIGVAAAGVGSVAYIAKSNLEKREQALVAQVTALKGSLPSTIKLEKVQSESNLFESKGKYVLTNNDSSDKSNNGQISLEYIASHGPNSWFGGNIQFIANGKIEGEFVKTYQVSTGKTPGMSFKVDGIITEDNSILSKNTVNDFSFVVPLPAKEEVAPVKEEAVSDEQNASQNPVEVKKEGEPTKEAAAKEATPKKSTPTGMLVNVKGNTSLFNFNTKTGEIQSKVEYQSIVAEDLEDSKDKITASNFAVNYDSNVKNLDIGTFKMNVASIGDAANIVKADGFEFAVTTEQKNQKYNMKLNTKIQKLKVMDQNGSFEVGYSINGIDKSMISLSQKIGANLASRIEFSEEEMKKAQDVLLSNLKTGFSVSLDKLHLQNDKNKIDFSGRYEVIPVQKDQEFSFYTQSKFGAELKIVGDMAPLVSSFFSSFAGNAGNQAPETTTETAPEAIKDFSFKLVFEKGSLKLNDKDVESSINENIANTLKTMDTHFGIGVPPVPVDVQNTDAAEPKPEAKEEEKAEVKPSGALKDLTQNIK